MGNGSLWFFLAAAGISGCASLGLQSRSSASLGSKRTGILDPSKVWWLHVPKTGTSFANVLVTWACPGLSTDAWVGEQTGLSEEESYVPAFMEKHGPSCWSGFTLHGAHPLLTEDTWSRSRGAIVGMFRQPEQRIMSGFEHHKHDMTLTKREVNDQHMDMGDVDLSTYATRVAGCAVKMMTGHACGHRDFAEVAAFENVTSESIVMTAIQRLQEFAFVGIVEEWGLSVCLFHIKFGVPAHEREIVNTRPSLGDSRSMHDTTALHGFRDEFDGPLYSEARQMFWTDINAHNITRESCEVTLRGMKRFSSNVWQG